MTQSTDAIFVRAGRPLRIHFDTTRLPGVAQDQLARRVESSGGVIVPLPGSSDVLIVDPASPWVFSDFLKTKRPELRPSVLLGFWIPLCLVSRKLIWIGSPHWENVVVPHERLPYPGTPQGVLVYGSFLAGRNSMRYDPTQPSRASPSLSNKEHNDTMALFNDRGSSADLSQHIALDLESDEEPLELSHSQRQSGVHPDKTVADSAIPSTSAPASQPNTTLPRSNAAPSPAIPVRPRVSTLFESLRLRSPAVSSSSILSRNSLPPTSDLIDTEMAFDSTPPDVLPSLSRHSTPASDAPNHVAPAGEPVVENSNTQQKGLPNSDLSDPSGVSPVVVNDATKRPASITPAPAPVQSELCPAAPLPASAPSASAPVASASSRTTSPQPIASTSALPIISVPIPTVPASVSSAPVSQGSTPAPAAPVLTLSTPTTSNLTNSLPPVTLTDAPAPSTALLKSVSPTPAGAHFNATSTSSATPGGPSPMSHQNTDASAPKDTAIVSSVAVPSIITLAQPALSNPSSALHSASSSHTEGSPLWKGPQDRQKRVPKSERPTISQTPSQDAQIPKLPASTVPATAVATPPTSANTTAPVLTLAAPNPILPSTKSSENGTTPKEPSNGIVAKPSQPSSSADTPNASTSRPAFVSPKSIKLRVSRDSSTSSGSISSGKAVMLTNGSSSTPQNKSQATVTPGLSISKPKSLKIRVPMNTVGRLGKKSNSNPNLMSPPKPKATSSPTKSTSTSGSSTHSPSKPKFSAPTIPPPPVAPTPTAEQLASKPIPYTKEEDQFIIDYMNWVFAQDRFASTSDIMREIASQLPYRTAAIWSKRFMSKEDSLYMQHVPVLFERLTNRTSCVGRPTSNRTTLEILSGTRTRSRKDIDYTVSSSEDEGFSHSSDAEYGGERRSSRKRSRLEGGRRSSRLG